MESVSEEIQVVGNGLENNNSASVLLMGLRRCGKSSICKVVFHNMQPLDTLYLESTSRPTTEHFKSLIDLAVMELPGQLNFFEPSSVYDSEKLFSSIGALVYVIDSQDEYLNALTNLSMIIEYAYKINPKIHIEVLIHKIDGLSEEFRMDTQRDIMQRVGDELLDLGLEGVQVSFHLTSIFDHSIYEAFSRIIQKLIFELPALENLLDLLIQYNKFEKIFLFDINSKIYVATDSSPVDIQTYEVCAEFIDVAIDLDGLYETTDKSKAVEKPIKCVSKLQSGLILYLHQMIRGLALVAVVRVDDSLGLDAKEMDERIKTQISLIDHNVAICRKTLEQMWKDQRIKE